MPKKLNNNALLAGSIVYLVSNILNAAIPFALLPILTRYLSPEEYGEIAMFQVLLGALTALIGLSMQGAAGRKFYSGAHEPKDLGEFIGSCLQILIVTTSLTLIILVGTSGKVSEWTGLDRHWIYLAALIAASSVMVQIRLGQWQVRKKARRYGVMQVSQSLVDFTLSVGLVVLLAWGSDGRISAQAFAALVFAILAYTLLKRDGLLKFWVWKPSFIGEALRFGVPLIPHVGGMFLLSSVDRFVINLEMGLAQAGIYMVAAQFAAALALLFDAVNKAYVPWLFERLQRNNELEKQSIVRMTYAWCALILCGAGLAFIVGPRLMQFVVGEQYSRAGDVIGWLVLGQVFGGMYLMVTNYIFFSKRTGLLSLVTIFSGLVNIVLLLFFIDYFGLKGAAYAFCIAMALRFLLTWVVAQRRHPMPWFRLNAQALK